MSRSKLNKITLHLLLTRSSSKVRLVFSPHMWGNAKLYRVKDEVDEKLLHYQFWEEDCEEWVDEQKADIGPIVAAVKLFQRAYRDIPFFKKTAKTIVHTKRAKLTREQFFELARTIEDLVRDNLDFQNLIVRDCAFKLK